MNQELIKYVMGEAAKSNVEKRQVGALIVAHHSDGSWDIVGRGYNIKDTYESSGGTGAEAETVETHAEAMACEDLYNSEYVLPEGTILTCYVTHPPCPACATLLAEHGVSNTEVVEAFMKFDGDKTRYDLVDPQFMTCCYDLLKLSKSITTRQLLNSLRHWQREPQKMSFLLKELLAYYDMDLMQLEKELAEVLTFGARKYKPNNWRNCSDTGRYLAAAIRHGRALIEGEGIDKESKLPHRAHLATNVMFLYCLGYN